MTYSGRPFPDDQTYKVNISGSRVSIRLRGLDGDGNLDYLAVVNEDDEIQGRADCDAMMGNECTLEVTIPSPTEYDRAFRYYGIAVDSEGAISEKTTRIEITSVWDKGGYASSPSPRPPTPPPPRPRPPSPPPPSESMTVTAGDAAVFEHDSGARIEIPEGGTVPVPSEWAAGPELIGTIQMASDVMVTVSITEFDTPVPKRAGHGSGVRHLHRRPGRGGRRAPGAGDRHAPVHNAGGQDCGRRAGGALERTPGALGICGWRCR